MMKIITLLIGFMVPFQISILAQDEEVLLSIDNQDITSEEFLRIYNKNQQNLQSGEKSSIEDYLDRFINFKLKVIEAQNRGFDTIPSVRRELKKYREELAKSYLRDEETMNELLRKAYERSKQEVKAIHILIKFPMPSSYQDTLHAYEKARKIRKRIIRKNENFSEVARGTSDDPSVKFNGGDLGYFTALQMIYPFEKKAYKLEIDEMSSPIRTRSGYHIIKKIDQRKARGKVKVAHIMLLAPNSMPEEKRQEKKERINEIYHQIKEGEEFEKLAKKFSEDKSSAQNGGKLPSFRVGRMVPEFEKAAFGMDNKGEISKPFKTSAGWHIVKLLDRETLGSFEEEKKELQQKLEKSPRYKIARDSMISGLKKDYRFIERKSNLKKLYKFIKEPKKKDSIAWDQLKTYPGNDTLFVIQDQLFHTGDFIKYLKNLPANLKKRFRGQYLLDKAYEQFQDDRITEYEKERLTEKYPEYKYLVKEYHDGILLFEIMDREVWSKS
ncbi:MAG: peptidylprolyl isomerase, partial [Bacteroidales bacterium]